MGRYYHVRVETKSDDLRHRAGLDWSWEQLEQRLLVPYREGRALVIGGETITLDNLRRVRITTTDEPSSTIQPKVRAAQAQSNVFDLTTSESWDIASWGDEVTEELITGPPGAGTASHSGAPETSSANPRAVFIVHGRDAKLTEAVFQFLTAIGLQPLEWSAAVAATGHPVPYVGDVLETAFSMAQAVVVLLSPDDEARLRPLFHGEGDPPHEVELTGQARPNVLFEAGMAMGRNQERTVLVEIGTLRPFSDIGGRHVVRLNNTSPRRQEFAQRLRNAGCPVDLAGTRWHNAGDLTPTPDG